MLWRWLSVHASVLRDQPQGLSGRRHDRAARRLVRADQAKAGLGARPSRPPGRHGRRHRRARMARGRAAAQGKPRQDLARPDDAETVAQARLDRPRPDPPARRRRRAGGRIGPLSASPRMRPRTAPASRSPPPCEPRTASSSPPTSAARRAARRKRRRSRKASPARRPAAPAARPPAATSRQAYVWIGTTDTDGNMAAANLADGNGRRVPPQQARVGGRFRMEANSVLRAASPGLRTGGRGRPSA